MTTLFDSTASRLGWKAERHERYVALARILIGWERAWPALWPASGLLGLYIAAALFGLTDQFPSALRALVCFAVLCATGYLLVRELRTWRMPEWEEGARRVERDSALSHRPISERGDRLGVGAGDAFAESLWRAHVAQLLARLGRLRLALPSPGLANKDPHSLRLVVLMLMAIGVLVAGRDWERRIALAFALDANGGAPSASLDAWITPPAYTGWAPIYLRPGSQAPIAVPRGSELVLRVHGGRIAPHLQFSPEPSGGVADFAGRDDAWGTRVKLTSGAQVNVQDASARLGHWRIRTIADQPPVIAFAAPPARTERDALKIAYTAGDDYGVVVARAIIRPLARHAHGVLSIDLPLPQASAKTVSETAFRDLTGHPFAGLDVEITLEARDGAGQIGRSKPVRMRLPERIFTNPLARALIEQRQQLAADAPNARARVAAMLDALAIAPQRFYANQPGIYLGLRTAYWTLRRARGPDETVGVEDMLWQMANALEKGGLYDAAQRLRAIAQLLDQALAQGAPQSTIDALMQRYQEALKNYLQSLAQNGAHSNGQQPPGAKVITSKDIEEMLKAIRQLAQTGARGKAQELLAMLQNMLENMRAAGTSGAGQGDKALSGAMQGLSGMIGKQRELLDKSLRQGEGAGDPKDGGGRGLAAEQGKLHQDLDRLLKGLSGRKVPGRENFDSASRAMGEAQGALGQQNFNDAGQAQKNALENMKNAASQLAQALAKEMGQDGKQGQEGQDPLGRAAGANGGVDGNVRLPNASELRHARAILEELRRRAAQPGRPKQELDYIDRLLRDF
jgi:uncharacterized protein (TIGR02302 family)